MKKDGNVHYLSSESKDALQRYVDSLLLDADITLGSLEEPMTEVLGANIKAIALSDSPPPATLKSLTPNSEPLLKPFRKPAESQPRGFEGLDPEMTQAQVKRLVEDMVEAPVITDLDLGLQAELEDADQTSKTVQPVVKQGLEVEVAEVEPEVEPEVELEVEVAKVEVAAIEVAEVEVAEVGLEVEIPEVEPQMNEESTAVLEQAVAPGGDIIREHLRWCENGQPQWAQSPFQCLLFKVANLTMAAPLVELGNIFPITDELTPLVAQAEWLIGIQRVNEINVRVVNTAKVIMPERYNEDFLEHIRYVISINGCQWGLAVNNVDQAVTLDPKDIRWRPRRSRRPWFAGIVIERLCTLIDVHALALLFIESDRHSRH